MEYFIDCSEIQNAQEFHILLAQSLAFPDWYGHNLDALYDCLTELPEPTHLVLKNWNTAANFSAGFESVFDDAHNDNPDFIITYQ